MSRMVGTVSMGIRAPIIRSGDDLVEIVTNGSLSGIGNKLLTDSREDNYRFFKTMTYGWVALVGGAAACMLCFYQPFIAAVWLGPEYLLDERLMMLSVLYFFSWMFRIMQLTYRDAAGLWTEDWLKPYVGMAVNLVGSIWMVKATGSIAGVLVPTILVFFFIYTPWEAWVVVKYQFYRSWNEYMGKLLGYVLLAFAACAACYGACRWLSPDNTILSLLLRCVIVGVIYPGIWLGVTGRTAEWKQLWGILLRFLPKGKKAA